MNVEYGLICSRSIDYYCPDDPDPDTTIDGDVIASAGRLCRLNGNKVKGNVIIEPGGTLRAFNVMVDGNVQSFKAYRVWLIDSYVGGNVQLKGTDGPRQGWVKNTRVEGDLQFEENISDMRAVRQHISGNAQFFKNNGDLKIKGNKIGGNLQCADNNVEIYVSNESVE